MDRIPTSKCSLKSALIVVGKILHWVTHIILLISNIFIAVNLINNNKLRAVYIILTILVSSDFFIINHNNKS